MKKCLFYLFAMLCTMSLFSCGNDKDKDDPNPGPGTDESWKAIAKDYTGDKLKLQFNGNEVVADNIKLETSSAEKGSVSLGGLIPGASALKVDVTMKATKADAAAIPTYAIEGQAKVDSRTISVKGAIQAGVLSLNVDIKTTSPLVGKWGLAPIPEPSDINDDGKIDGMDYNLMGGCFFLALTTKDGYVTFQGQTIPDMQFCMFADQKAEAFLRASLKEVSFLENGTIVFTYIKDGKELPLAGIAGYYIKEVQGTKMVYMTIDIMGIMGMMQSKSDNNPIEDLITLAQNGIPLAFMPSEDGKTCSLMINKDMAKELIPKLSQLLSVLPNIPGMADKPELLPLFQEIGNLMGTIAASEEFSVGFNLVKQ